MIRRRPLGALLGERINTPQVSPTASLASPGSTLMKRAWFSKLRLGRNPHEPVELTTPPSCWLTIQRAIDGHGWCHRLSTSTRRFPPGVWLRVVRTRQNIMSAQWARVVQVLVPLTT